jgi:hypothetical protein
MIGLALAGQAQAAGLSCDEALARVDTFGRLRWKDPVKTPPAWAVEVECQFECYFADPEGTRYALGDGFMMDKELVAGTGTPWPWGLDSHDGPAEAKAKLARLLPNEGSMNVREGGPTYNLDIADCMVWIEVTFEGERGIKAVSLNAQP